MKKADVEEFYSRLQAQNPEPKGELDWVNPFTLLVAVVLSAHGEIVRANHAAQTLLGLRAQDSGIRITLLVRHPKFVEMFEQHGSVVPNDQEALEALPGVGRKTANVVRNIAFGEPTIAVDTHIFRIGNRTGIAPGKTPLAVEKKLLKVTPAAYMRHAHHWLILHGRYVCKARKPDCAVCVVADLCRFKGKTV